MTVRNDQPHAFQILNAPMPALTAEVRVKINGENHKVMRSGHVYHVLSLDTWVLARQQQLQQTLPGEELVRRTAARGFSPNKTTPAQSAPRLLHQYIVIK